MEDILKVYVACEDFLALGPEPKASAAMIERDIKDAETESGVFRAVVHGNSETIGVASYVSHGFEGYPERAFILLLMVMANRRCHGVGGRILHTIEDEIRRETNATEIHTAVQMNNPTARRFWERNGYKAISGAQLRPDGTTVIRLSKTVGRTEQKREI